MEDQSVTPGFPTDAGVPELSSRTAYDLWSLIALCEDNAQLTDCAKKVWGAFGDGLINEAEADRLSRYLEIRRPPTHPSGDCLGVGKHARLSVSGFRSRRYQRSPNRDASRRRRRTLGGSGALPHELRGQYTEGQRSVLTVVAMNQRNGVCDLPIDQIAALAGVCRTTVQNTVSLARRFEHLVSTPRPRPGRKNLTNLLRIVSADWLKWIARGAVALRRIGSKLNFEVHPTKSNYLRKRATEGALEEDATLYGTGAGFAQAGGTKFVEHRST